MSTSDKILAALALGPLPRINLAPLATDSGELAWVLATLRVDGRVVADGTTYRLA